MSNTLPHLEEENSTAIAKAKAVVENLLKTLSIQRVVYIDDYFDEGIDWVIEHISVGLITGKESQLQSLYSEIEFDEADFWQAEVRRDWDASDDEAQARLIEAIVALKLAPDSKDRQAAEALRMLMPESVDYQAISPKKYDQFRLQWLDSASADQKIFCLFDLEFKYRSEGDVELGGLTMLERDIVHVGAKQDNYDGKALFGIYSHTFKIKEERERGATFSESNGIPLTVFLPISKERRYDSSKLAAGLQMLVLNIYTGNIKKMVKGTMSKACKLACEELEKLDVFDFDDMVLNSSFQEGVWEGETLLRLFLLLQRRRGLEGLANAQTSGQLNSFVQLARGIAQPRLIDHKPTDPLQLRRLELYEEGISLNSFHTPLRAGDIFKLKGGYEYILLCPPCDLMVRSESEDKIGRRGVKPNELKQVDLFRIRTINQKEYAELTKEQISVLGFLKNYKDQKLGRISFKERLTVPVAILDLAALNADGSCSIDLSNIPPVPAQFHPAWQARHALLVAHFNELAGSLAPLESMLHRQGIDGGDQAFLQQVKKKMLAVNVTDNLPEDPSFVKNVFNFKFKRIAHYHYSATQHLLTQYAHFLSRAAEEHDFSFVRESSDRI